MPKLNGCLIYKCRLFDLCRAEYGDENPPCSSDDPSKPVVAPVNTVQQAKGRNCPKCHAEVFTVVNGRYQCQECCHWFE